MEVKLMVSGKKYVDMDYVAHALLYIWAYWTALKDHNIIAHEFNVVRMKGKGGWFFIMVDVEEKRDFPEIPAAFVKEKNCKPCELKKVPEVVMPKGDDLPEGQIDEPTGGVN